jgi:hypothetical protein
MISSSIMMYVPGPGAANEAVPGWFAVAVVAPSPPVMPDVSADATPLQAHTGEVAKLAAHCVGSTLTVGGSASPAHESVVHSLPSSH